MYVLMAILSPVVGMVGREVDGVGVVVGVVGREVIAVGGVVGWWGGRYIDAVMLPTLPMLYIYLLFTAWADQSHRAHFRLHNCTTRALQLYCTFIMNTGMRCARKKARNEQ